MEWIVLEIFVDQLTKILLGLISLELICPINRKNMCYCSVMSAHFTHRWSQKNDDNLVILSGLCSTLT